jgi:hypothetical protein
MLSEAGSSIEMSHASHSDREFVGILRDAINRFFAAVDGWESVYGRFYRMPGAAKVSEDLVAEQRQFEVRRRELAELLPRARVLCYRYGQTDVFGGLLHVSLGQFAPQERTDSAIGRGERGAIMACLIELNVACREAEAGLPPRIQGEVRKTSLLDRIIDFLF